ncbi:UDP-N-acetylmuramate dehydrogenase, partial [Nocardioides sp. Y6]|nr:UDP-N-acetylmuramate dehydrogenase [Nocardioides malaquae]
MIHYVQKVVFERFGVHLQTEVRIIGEDVVQG